MTDWLYSCRIASCFWGRGSIEVWGLRCRFWGAGLGIWNLEVRVYGWDIGVWDTGFRRCLVVIIEILQGSGLIASIVTPVTLR